MRLKGMTAIVTGAASGLGEATARRFAEEGARIVVADIDGEKAAEVARQIDASGSTAIALACDITSAAACGDLVARAEDFFGAPIDIFHANAGTSFSTPLGEAEPGRIERTIEINLLGAVFSAQAAMPSLVRSGNGVLLFTSSLQAILGRPARSVYTATKHAITGLVKSLALEFGPQNVRVNAIAPTGIDTPLLRLQLSRVTDDVDARIASMAASLPLGRMPTPRDFTDAAVFLASAEARCITGQTLVVDCGASAGIAEPRPAAS
ncbi:3-oxoacyl-[acyl-carrier protein] reductase [Faunimonas pinastri]|uniref:3-oxoacyl-[acyl-carrier protein] reductase n=1 Tax=Faunimonas pinastri TaxID=1855383 RepID=A0A1H9EDH4_9HYPH|nr:glucose 1-dehydrogenase [Faunimonas pinastri]SEQ23699.1 3-oxoacyl-[acyl-carrier protein] reductase [Faunimonas pinastri]